MVMASLKRDYDCLLQCEKTPADYAHTTVHLQQSAPTVGQASIDCNRAQVIQPCRGWASVVSGTGAVIHGLLLALQQSPST